MQFMESRSYCAHISIGIKRISSTSFTPDRANQLIAQSGAVGILGPICNAATLLQFMALTSLCGRNLGVWKSMEMPIAPHWAWYGPTGSSLRAVYGSHVGHYPPIMWTPPLDDIVLGCKAPFSVDLQDADSKFKTCNPRTIWWSNDEMVVQVWLRFKDQECVCFQLNITCFSWEIMQIYAN